MLHYLDELSLRFVLALPKASRMSLDFNKTSLARSISACPDTFVTAAMYLKNGFGLVRGGVSINYVDKQGGGGATQMSTIVNQGSKNLSM